MVTWFAGLFYIVRLFIYQTEAQDKSETERDILTKQFKLMAKRLWYGITWPSAILIGIFATWMLVSQPAYLKTAFMQVKLFFITGLYLYHLACHSIFKKLQADKYPYSSFKLRLWNELATLFLVSIIFVIVLRDAIGFIWGVVGLIAIALLLFAAIRIYKQKRSKS